ncbi:MAG: T9SS type A sorting domain-containing protein [Salibacteraceae bacterium]
MRLKITYILLTGLMSVFAISLFGQTNTSILDSYSVIEVDGTVYISCVISSGSTCNGINVFKSTDSIDFQVIGNIAGVCGSSDNPVRYEFTDEQPKINAVNYYKLELGGVGFTPTLSVDFRSFQDNQVQIAPNPITNSGIIFFKNPTNEKVQIEITSITGATVFNSFTNAEKLNLNSIPWVSGMYLVKVIFSDSTKNQYGKLLKN